MMRNVLFGIGLGLLPAAGVSGGTEYQGSPLSAELSSLRYGTGSDLAATAWDVNLNDDVAESAGFEDGSGGGNGRKSPTKAFLLSMAVPGAGQWYYGSKTRALLFFGAEVATWALYFNFHSDATGREDEFEAFNLAHWSRDAYEKKYLYNAYPSYQRPGEDYVDDEWITEQEISHRLPDGRPQQYYEMTGKYDQFSWGWDDAIYNGLSLDSLIALGTLEAVTDASKRPFSANRVKYETMRDEANDAFAKANNMIIVGIVNRLLSGFEAYFVTKGRQGSSPGGFGATLERVKVRADLKTYTTKRDTPFVTVAVKF